MKFPFHFKRISSSLIFWIAVISIPIYFTIIAISNQRSIELASAKALDLAARMSLELVSDTEAVLSGAANTAATIASVVDFEKADDSEVRRLIRNFLTHNPDIYGMGVALEPHASPTQDPYAVYYYRSNLGLSFENLARDEYGYREHDWYLVPKNSRAASWSEPYFDEGGGEAFLVTYSVPLFRFKADEREFVGVVTADVEISWLKQVIESKPKLPGGARFVLSRAGLFITHPLEEKILQPVRLSVPVTGHDAIERIIRRIENFEGGSETINCIDKRGLCWISHQPIGLTGLSAVVIIERDEFLADVFAATRINVGIAIVGLAFLLAMVFVMSRRATEPLERLVDATREVGSGKIGSDLSIRERFDEVGQLTRAFEKMQGALKGYISRLQSETAHRQRLESEFEIAADIQMQMLPSGKQAHIDKGDHELFVSLEPAQLVGGDLYDFEYDGDAVHFAVGDVSDKGVAASLFMARTITVVRTLRERLQSPAALLAEVNQRLTQLNDACMFVTLIVGTLDRRTGTLIYASAGHEAPLLRRGADGGIEWLRDEGGPALGLLEDATYPEYTCALNHDDLLVLYSDGITEALDTSDTAFGESRLEAALTALPLSERAEAVGQALVGEVTRFVGEAEQSDDRTLLIVQISAGALTSDESPSPLSLSYRRDLDEFDRLREVMGDFVRETPLDPEVVGELELVLDELLANAVAHGDVPGASEEINLAMEWDGAGVKLTFTESGPPFNPLEATAPDLTLPLEDRPIGGLGLFLVQEMTDEQTYRREGDRNILTLRKTAPTREES